MMIYVCDRCGLLTRQDAVPEGATWECDSCGSSAAWEYPGESREAANEQSLRIAAAQRTGLFREAR